MNEKHKLKKKLSKKKFEFLALFCLILGLIGLSFFLNLYLLSLKFLSFILAQPESFFTNKILFVLILFFILLLLLSNAVSILISNLIYYGVKGLFSRRKNV